MYLESGKGGQAVLTVYDYVVIGFFVVFMVSLGPIFKHFSKDDSDYFRGGAKMLWWMVGASAFMCQFSAWTFTGAASKAYKDGMLVSMIFFANAFGFLFNYLWFAARFRQMRIITCMESVRERFSAANEQIFTWLQVPLGLVYAGIWLNGLAVFCSAVFDLNLTLTIWVVGAVVVFVSFSGGARAITACDFIQMLILMAIAIVTPILVLAHHDIGGLGGLLDKLPARHFDWTAAARPQIIWLWIIAVFLKQFITLNNMQTSYRYLGVKDSHQARKAALLATILMAVGPFIWFIPPMAATIFEPNIANAFPQLKTPSEAAYIVAGQYAFPVGMMGLLICGLFSATMSSMDSGLNRNAGIFIRSFYQRVVKVKSPTHLLVAGRAASLLFGLLIILIGVYISNLEEMDLFTVMMQFSGLIAIPVMIPMVLGMLIKQTPSWSGWSTVLVGFIASIVTTNFVSTDWVVERFSLNAHELSDYKFFFGTLANVIVSSIWFMMTIWFYKRTSADYKERVENFFTNMHTPVDFEKEIGEGNDKKQSNLLGLLCLIYGGFIALLALIPNSALGRISFLICAGIIGGVGLLLMKSGKKELKAS
jgi:solute:Na+ symporter, SSS family